MEDVGARGAATTSTVLSSGRRKLCAWLAVAWAVVIFASSSMPADDLGAAPWWAYDKLVHGIVFAVLGALVAAAFAARPRAVAAALAVAVVAVYGASDELHQAFVAGRDASGFDFLADVAGGGIGAVVVSLARGSHGHDPDLQGQHAADR